MENIGFIFQQLALFLQSRGIGNCWAGMASLKEKNPNFVIAISFGKSYKMTRELSNFKRKKLSEISDVSDERLIPAQLAPSAINSQSWYFKHTNEGFDVYQAKQNLLKRRVLKKWNPIGIGIALAHMYMANSDSFEFFKKSDFEEIKGYTYSGSIKI
ncbi:nitroreductase family protein [Methanobrevibacter sp. V74]|uniref:nitroreductase family protein n=1 Tax=Methanobrevibacter sp. V74 TaxID=3064279 RepID=UPI0027370CE7|nr:nitroreductase family protein [Methanobrevibacter sp. V74]